MNNLSIGPYAYKGNQWVGYDTPKSAKNKANYIVAEGLGGAMIWDYSTDDFRNKCGLGEYPVMNAIKSGLDNCNGGAVTTNPPITAAPTTAGPTTAAPPPTAAPPTQPPTQAPTPAPTPGTILGN